VNYERHLHVALPPAELFAFLCDEGRLVEWRDGLVACRRLDDAPDGSSRRYAETFETPLGRQTVTVAVIADPVARRLAFEVLDGPYDRTANWFCAPLAPAATSRTASRIRRGCRYLRPWTGRSSARSPATSIAVSSVCNAF